MLPKAVRPLTAMPLQMTARVIPSPKTAMQDQAKQVPMMARCATLQDTLRVVPQIG